ncbi:hypothetical protein PMSD_09580 [Paenibacillus macquariensis subsp. defensor]|nr:hypothetical protein PMSD_09580 [Paenibacillus macquariensis subsp. defensor]
MNKRNIIVILFPALVMAIIAIITFTQMFGLSDLNAKSLIIAGLVLIFPVLFVLQGVLCAVTRSKVILSIVVSIVTYIIIMFVFLNSSAFVYLIVYLGMWAIGYWIGKYMIRSKDITNN